MKILFILLFAPAITVIIPTKVKAQANIDTVLIRPEITMQAGDWAWLRGKLGGTKDSTLLTNDRRINALIKPLLPLAYTTNVSIDSLPGRLVFAFYQALKTANAGEIVARYTAINNALSGVTQLAYWYGLLDGNLTRDYEATRNYGKNVYVDQ